MIFCFMAQALVCLIPSRRPSSTELIPFLAVAISHIARNQLVSGSLVAWKMVPAVSETWCRQARHWIFGRVLSHLPSQPPQTGQTNPDGPAQFLDHRPALLLAAVGLAELRLAQAPHLGRQLSRHIYPPSKS